MGTRWMHLWLTLCLGYVFTMAGSGAQTLNPTLGIETEDGQRTFRIGERIPLRLSFINPEGKPYLVESEPCGTRYCGAWWKPEAFEVQPATGWSDPLATFFAQYFAWSGKATMPHPPTKPLQVLLDLNEWVRFEEPGDYTVKITSHRIASSSA